MGEKLKQFGNYLLQSIIIILVFICIFYSDKQIDNENYITLLSILTIKSINL